MNRRLLFGVAAAAALALGSVTVSARRPPLPAAELPLPPAGVLAVTDVTIIDGTGGAPRTGRTVLVRNGVIAAIGPSGTIAVPPDAQVVDGRGGFLIPGLWDMHGHGVLADRRASIYRRLLVAFGVTGTRVMEEQITESELGRRTEPSADLDILGPRVVRSGRVVNGPGGVSETSLTVRSAGDGVAVLDSLAQGGSDFVKVYNLVGREAYFALLREARRRGVPVGGHVPFAISVEEASDSGQSSMEHLSGVLVDCSARAPELRTMLRDSLAVAPDESDATAGARYERIERIGAESWDASRCAALARKLVANGTAITPTLVQLRRHALATRAGELLPEYFQLVAPGWPDRFAERVEQQRQQQSPAEQERKDALHRLRLRTVELFADAGVEILAGTDASIDFVVPGVSLHEELQLLHQAGLDPAAALRAATLAPARHLGISDSLGTIAIGKQADMVLLDADPLVDIYNTRRIRAVVLRGRLLDAARLQQLRAEAAVLAARRDDVPRAPGLPATARAWARRLLSGV